MTIGTWVQGRRRWMWLVAGVLVLAAGAVAVALGGGDGGDDALVEPGPATTDSPTTDSPTTSAAPTTTTPPVPTTAPPAPTTTEPAAPVPGLVAVVTARPGGGSGEVVVRWEAVPGATGYRVLRGDAAAGPFGMAADIDIVSGRSTATTGVTNVWSDEHSYVPEREALAGPDGSAWFEFVEQVEAGERWYRVVACNEAGAGPASSVVSGSPP